MKRREFITLIVAAAAAWPLAARAQQTERVRRIGVLMGLAETDQFTQGYVRELRDRLQQLGWTDNRKIRFTYRYAAGDHGAARAFAKELVEMQPDLDASRSRPDVFSKLYCGYSTPARSGTCCRKAIRTTNPFIGAFKPGAAMKFCGEC
jgi:putative tryptophan/tyrosine transport system substrate-binding protein